MAKPVAESNQGTTRPKVDWEGVEREHGANRRSLRDIGEEFGCSEGAIRKRAKRDGWIRGERQTKEKVVISKDSLDRSGFVYVIYLDDSSSRRFYKIGMSANFSSRFDSHQCSSPFDVCVACAYFVANMRAEEKAIHQMFSSKRIRGEWFELATNDISIIAERSRLI